MLISLMSNYVGLLLVQYLVSGPMKAPGGLFDALASYLTTYATRSVRAGLLAAPLVGVLTNAGLAWMYVTARASQVVAGIVFNVLALGSASFLYRLALGTSATPQMIRMVPALRVPVLSDLPLVGPVLFSHSIPLYGALALVAVSHVVLFRTRFGLALRAAGESPRAAEAAGIDGARMRYLGVLISGGAAGLSGAYTILAEVGLFRETIVSVQAFNRAVRPARRWRRADGAVTSATCPVANRLTQRVVPGNGHEERLNAVGEQFAGAAG